LAEEPTPLKATFAAAPIEPIPPDEALDYFRSLVPELGRDPRLTQRLERQAFTLAVNTERYVLGRVQRVIADALKTGAGVSRGVGSAAIDKILDAAGVGPTKRGYSEMVFRTNMMDSYNQGSMRELQQPDVADVFPAWKYLGVLDGREGDDHRPKFGRYYLTKDEFARVRGPRVYNCVLPGAAVGGEFVGGFRADYSGQAVKIETASGVRLAVTANHPVLTDRGFIPACQLKKGDRLANCRRYVKSDFFVEDNQDRPPRIEDVFDALAIAAPARRSSVVAGRLDFYGDGAAIKSEIDVVGADVFAQLNANSGGGECRCESLLRRPDMLRSLVPSRGSACHHFGAVALAAPSGLRGGDLSFAAVDVSDFAPLEPLRVGLAARLNVSRREPADDRRPADAELFGELIDGFSGVVTPDHIVDIKRFSYSGHVYDLATNVGYFAAGHNRNVGSIVIANCRCSFAPAMADEAKAAGLKFSEQDFCGGNGGKACVITGEEPPEFDDAAIKRALEERLAASDED
jgi:hypothetical protein